MNRAEMAVAFGRRCGFASGRLLGAACHAEFSFAEI
jgi:hypothetical protein